MSNKNLEEGDTIYIKRTNGDLQTAIVTQIDYECMCVKVEWLENRDTKGKEIHFSNVLSLNPNVVLIGPKCITHYSSQESGDEESVMITSRKPTRVHSAKHTPFKKNASYMDQMKIEGKQYVGIHAALSFTETGLKSVIKNNNHDRLNTRRKGTEERSYKNQMNRQNANSPSNWKLLNMIQEFRRKIQMHPLTNDDPIDDHLITVAVRKRPLNDMEKRRKEIDIITVPDKNQIVVHEPKLKLDLTKYLENHRFIFDYALNENCSNHVIYKYTAQPLIKTIFDGGFATCFAYGQTGSGKTYTMSGSYDGKENGIYALSASDIFKIANQSQYRSHSFIVSCSFFEIYGKKVFDLLQRKQELRVLEDGKQQVQIKGLTEKIVSNVDEVLELIFQGNEERACGQTSANSHSSRSHAIFQFYLRSQMNSGMVYGKFSLIDLAGNERGADNFTASKITRMEGADINQSLLSLKECIRALGRKDAHLPFRGSKLTQVLRDSFIGYNSKTCMIAMISPGANSCEHTLNTLRYADRVKELGGGDLKLEQTAVESVRCSLGTQSIQDTPVSPIEVEKSTDEKMKNFNNELIKTMKKYTRQAESLIDLNHVDLDTYYVNLNIVVTDAITSLIHFKNQLMYNK